MLADAIAAEAYKIRRNRLVCFWGFLFAPVFLLLFNLSMDTYFRAGMNAGVKIDFGRQLLLALGAVDSPFLQSFYALAAAVIFAGEYRWETWRLLAPRNSRANFLAAKFLVYAVACAASLLAIGLFGIVHVLYDSALSRSSPIPPSGSIALQALGVFATSWLELLLLGALTAFVGIASRSVTAALITGILSGFVQLALMTQISIINPPWTSLAFVPRASIEAMGAYFSQQPVAPGAYLEAGSAALAAMFVVVWIAMLITAAFFVLQRQDLSRE